MEPLDLRPGVSGTNFNPDRVVATYNNVGRNGGDSCREIPGDRRPILREDLRDFCNALPNTNLGGTAASYFNDARRLSDCSLDSSRSPRAQAARQNLVELCSIVAQAQPVEVLAPTTTPSVGATGAEQSGGFSAPSVSSPDVQTTTVGAPGELALSGAEIEATEGGTGGGGSGGSATPGDARAATGPTPGPSPNIAIIAAVTFLILMAVRG